MVKHIILWQLKDDLADKDAVKASIKAGLEGLRGKIPGLIEIRVITEESLESSNADLMLDTAFEDEKSLQGYAVHPDHVAVAENIVRPNVKLRLCMDYSL